MTWRGKSFHNVIIVKQILLTVVEYLIRLFQGFVLIITLVNQRLMKVSKKCCIRLECVREHIHTKHNLKKTTLNSTRKAEVYKMVV